MGPVGSATPVDPDDVPCGLLSLAADGTVTYANAAARQLLGQSRSPLEGRPFDELLAPGARAYVQLMLRPRLDLDGRADEVALVMRTDDGIDVHVLANLAVRWPDGQRRTDCAIVRLRQRKELEDRLLHMSRTVAQMPGILFRLVDVGGGAPRVLHAGPGLAELTGLAHADLVATPRRLAAIVDPAELPGLVERLAAARRSRAITPLTVRLLPPGQPARWVRLHADAHPQGEGDVVWQGVAYDVTQQQQVDERLRSVDKLQAVATLAAGVAHDFNNLLGSIIGLAELAQREAAPGSRQLRNLEQLRHAAGKASTLVRQLLDFSRQTPQRFEATPVGEFLGRIEPLLRASLPAGVALDIRVEASPVVRIDVSQIEQSLLNLVKNAVHAVAGVPEAAIAIVVDEAEMADATDGIGGAGAVGGAGPGRRMCRLRVIDNGHGIDAGTLPRIFEPFFTTKPVGEGTGLGLAAVHGVVAGHGGHVGVDTMPGRGSTFSVCLPCVESPAGLAERAPARGDRD